MASKLKLVELTGEPWTCRWAPLQESVSKELGVELETEIRSVTRENLQENIVSVLASDFDLCRIDDDYCVDALNHIPRLTHKAVFSGACSFLEKRDGVWWPRPLLDSALRSTLLPMVGPLDLEASALVAGASGAAKLVVAALVALGFGTIDIADRDPVAGKSFIDELNKKYFGVKFEFIPHTSVTSLPGEHDVMVNATKLGLDNDLLDELYFFNFLKAGGIVADLTLVPSATPLILEAQNWGARRLSGDVIAAHRDAAMLELVTQKKIDVEDYRRRLRALVDAVPFDPSPYLQRFSDRSV